MLALLSFAYILYVLSLVVYRLYFHPLAKYPGPRIAAISRWHEFYYDVLLKGRFSTAIETYHDKYGPIVRITPDELHIRDSKFYEDFYTKHGRGNKMKLLAARFGTELCTFSTPDAQLHALRRNAITPYFSRQRMIAFEHVIRDKAASLVRNIKRLEESKTPFNIQAAWSAYVGDVITLYSFSFDLDHLNSEHFSGNFHDAIVTMSYTGPIAVQYPVVPKIMMALPDALVERLNPTFSALFSFQRLVRAQVRKLKYAAKLEKSEENRQGYETILKSLLENPDLPPSEKDEDRLIQEAIQFIAAGLLTTSWSLSVGVFHIISNPEINRKLRRELDKAIPDPNAPDAFSWTELEKLPYLTGCIKESVRLAYPVSG